MLRDCSTGQFVGDTAACPQRRRLDEAMLAALALGELGQRLARDQGLEVLALLMLGESRLILENLVEEELLGLARRLVDLERLDARLTLGLRQEAPDDVDQRLGLARLRLPEGGDDEAVLERVKISHR